MTLGKLALASVLGMLVTGTAVYFLTSPSPAPPVAPPLVPADAAPADSSTEQDAREDERLAELAQEVERLRALLDGSAPADANADPAPPIGDAAPAASLRVEGGPLPSPVAAPEAPGVCKPAMSEEAFTRLLESFPALRQLPPTQLQRLKNASPDCPCTLDPKDQRVCMEWCSSQSDLFFRLKGQCISNKCQCTPD